MNTCMLAGSMFLTPLQHGTVDMVEAPGSTMAQAFVFKSFKITILTAFRHEHVYARGLGVASAARVVPRITERGVAHGQA